MTGVAPSGIEFVGALMAFAGSVSAAAALALGMVETGPNEELNNARRRLAGGWRSLAAMPAVALPRCVTAWLAAKLDAVVAAMMDTVDQAVAFGGFMFALIYVFVPLAAAVNAYLGGSALLFGYYLSLLAVLVVLLFTGQSRRFGTLNGLAAAFLGISLFLVIPIYVTRAFTELTINGVFSHSVLKSFLVAVFWYVSAYGIGVAFDTGLRFLGRDPARSPAALAARRLLAALPVAYVLTFLGLLAGHFAVLAQSPHRSWQMLLVVVGAGAGALPVTLSVMACGARKAGAASLAAAYGLALAAASALSLVAGWTMHLGTPGALGGAGALRLLIGLDPGGGGVSLGPDFWVSHLAFVPVAAFLVALGAGFAARAATALYGRAAGAGAAERTPFLAAAYVCAGMGVVLWAGSLAI